MSDIKHIVILGNGISGITTAREIRKRSKHKITVVSKETKYFFSRTALMYVYMGQLKFEHTQPYENTFWKKNNIELIFDEAISINTGEKKLLLKTTTLSFDILVLACGSIPAFYNWKGQNFKGVQGLYSAHDLSKMEENTIESKNAVIIGGGLIGIEMAEMLHSRNISVTLLVREKTYWQNVLPLQEGKIIESEIRKNNINVKFETSLEEIIGNNGITSAVRTNQGEIIPCQFVGIATGVVPNVEFLRSTPILIDKGIIVNNFLETNIPNVYAIGDCAQHASPIPSRKNIEQTWYTGKIMGETLAKTICEKKTMYNPGIWFNSAKFFSLEYQTYGLINTTDNENSDSFYWENSSKNTALRISFNKNDKSILGIHSLGIRLRQNICEEWIKNKVRINDVIQQLDKANFDAEFSKKHNKEIFHQYYLSHN